MQPPNDQGMPDSTNSTPSPQAPCVPPTYDLQEYASIKSNQLIKRVFKKAEAAAVHLGDEELHQMRVGTRRLREFFNLFAPFYPPAPLKESRRQIKKITRILGLPRELDVNSTLLSDLDLSDHTEGQTCFAREHLLEILDIKRQKARHKTKKSLERLDLNLFQKELRRLSRSGLRIADASPAADADLTAEARQKNLLRVLLMERYQPLEQYPVEKVNDFDDNSLHQLRIHVKKLRYALEICKPIWEESCQDLIQQAADLQMGLGNYHDLEVLRLFIQEHQQELILRKRPRLTAALDLLIQEIRTKKETLRGGLPDRYKALKDSWDKFSATPALSQPAFLTNGQK
jgi:CHAD domain-containing protein